MPLFDIEDEKTGRKFSIEGDSEPTEQELNEIFSSEEAPATTPVRTPLDDRAILGDYLKQTTPTAEQPFRQPQDFPSQNKEVVGIAGENIPTAFNKESVPQILSKLGSEAVGKPLEIAGKGVVGAFNLPTTVQNFVEQDLLGSDKPPLKPVYEYGKPLLDLKPEFTPDELESMTPWQRRIAGATESVGGAVSQLTTPENIALLPAFGSPKVAKPLAGYLLGLVGLQEPAAIEKAIEKAQDPNATPEEAAAAFTDAAVVNPIFAALLGKQVKGPGGKQAAINALIDELKKEPALNPKTPKAQRQLGVRLDQGENVLGTPELQGLADRALQQGPNPPLARGDVSALEQIRRELNPPEIKAVEPSPRVAGRPRAAGESIVKPTLEGIKIEPGFERTASDMLQERDRTGALQGEEPSLRLSDKVSPEATRFADDLLNPDKKVSTDDASATGVKLSSVADLDAILAARSKFATTLAEAKAKAKADPSQINKYAAIASRGQIFREAIEAATNTGSHKVSARILSEKNLPEPKLDWTKNPEVAAWLKKNGEQLGIDVSEVNATDALRTGDKVYDLTETPVHREVVAEVEKLKQEFPGGLEIEVVDSYQKLPDSTHQAAYRQGANPAQVSGAVAGNKVYINSSNLGSLAEARQIFLHEQAGHFATDRILGPKLNRFMGQTAKSFAKDALMGEVRSRYKTADDVLLGREYVARLAENPAANPTAWNKVVAQFRSWLRDIGWVKEVTENDIRVLLSRATESLKNKAEGKSPEEVSLSLKSAAEKANERFPEERPRVIPKAGDGGALPAGAGKPTASAETHSISGGPERMRQSAARATTSENVPPVVQERIAEAPESFYTSQKYKSVEEAVAAAGDAELAAVPKDSNFHVASQLELSRRLFAQGNLEEGYNVFKAVSKQGTEWGQNINQFKMLKGTTPANVIDLVNQGLKESGRDPLSKKQMEDLATVADESIQANRNLETSKQDWQKNPTDANAKKAQDALESANAKDLETQRAMNRFKVKTWPQMLKTFAQGNPLTPISHVSNFVGNTLGAAMEGSSRSVANLIDATRSMLTGKERKVSSSPIRGAGESAKAFGRGVSKVPEIMLKGTGDVVKGESSAGLQPLRSLVKAFAKNPDVPTVGGKVPINERIRMAVEGTFGIAPETMLRLLSAADRPAYEAARARLINEQAKLKKLPAKDLPMAQKFPELFFDKEALKQIKLESADAIFQRPSKAINYLQALIREKGGDWGDLAFTIAVSPYKLTPWNLVVRTLQYNPLIAATKAAIEAGKGNTRAAEISAGRMVVGSILYGAGYYLYQNGLIGPSLEGRGEAQKARLLSGEVLPPNHVNISGLKRAVAGGDPEFRTGDETIDLTRGGGAAGAILSSVANIGRKMEKKPEAGGGELAASLVRDGVLEQANFTINQSFLKGVTGVLDAIQNGNLGPYVTGVENMLLNVPTPNTLTALSRATRENAPDMKADTVAQEFGNVVRNRFGILGADDYLATKRDLFGEPMPQTPEGRNAILYHLFDISKGRQVTDDPAKLEIYRVWRRTADSQAIPSIPERQITIGGQTYQIPNNLYSRFAELVGKERKVILDEIVKNPNFLSAPDDMKLDLLDRIYGDGLKIGKGLFWQEHGDKLTPNKPKAGFKK